MARLISSALCFFMKHFAVTTSGPGTISTSLAGTRNLRLGHSSRISGIRTTSESFMCWAAFGWFLSVPYFFGCHNYDGQVT